MSGELHNVMRLPSKIHDMLGEDQTPGAEYLHQVRSGMMLLAAVHAG